jgi:hypothetical protein
MKLSFNPCPQIPARILVVESTDTSQKWLCWLRAPATLEVKFQKSPEKTARMPVFDIHDRKILEARFIISSQ